MRHSLAKTQVNGLPLLLVKPRGHGPWQSLESVPMRLIGAVYRQLYGIQQLGALLGLGMRQALKAAVAHTHSQILPFGIGQQALLALQNYNNLIQGNYGGTSTTTGQQSGGSTVGNVLGGGLSGAGIGSMIGGPVGAGIGAIAGGLLGLF